MLTRQKAQHPNASMFVDGETRENHISTYVIAINAHDKLFGAYFIEDKTIPL